MEPTEAPTRPRSVLRVVLGSPRPVWILVIGVFLNRSGSYFSTFLALFLGQIGFSLRELPLVLLVVGAAIPLGSMLGGWIADRYSRRSSLVGTTLLAAVGLAVIGLAPTRELALVGVFMASLFAQSYLPAASSLLLDHTKQIDRVPTFAFFRLALNLGAAVGPVVAIAIVPYGLNLLFLISSGCYLVFALVMIVGLPAEHRQQADTGVTAPAAAATLSRPSTVRLVVLLASVLGITMVYVQYASSVSLAVAQSHDAAFYAAMLTLNAMLVIAIELPLSSWTRRLPTWVPLLLGTTLMAVGIPLSGAFPVAWLTVAGVLVWTVGEILFSPVVATAVADLSAADRVGRYQGYLVTVQAVAFALGPAVGTFVYSLAPGLLWAGCLIVGALCAVGFIATRLDLASPHVA